ncbi:MAG: magnesium transporter [Archaeoglobaceae archaeon]|nr:magnesium transporter [Archaeoglobaceae archaeon]MDW8117706.1 magnesium transporter [Archaeoglobaceae archaeon]
MIIPERELSFRMALRLIVPVLYLCLVFDIFAGFFLGTNFEKFVENYPYLLIILPGLMGLRGNVFGAMASRLSTAFYLGSSEANFKDRYVTTNSFFSIWLATMPVLILLLIAFIKYPDLNSMITATQIAVSSSVISAVFLSICTASVVILAFRKAIDPDSISGPFITSVADLITIPSLVFLIILFEIQISWILALIMFLIFLISVFFSAREKKNWRIYKESLAIVCSLAFIQSITGNILDEFSEIIYLSLFMGFAYPSIIDQLGNYGSIVVARTSTKLHLGEIEGFDLKKAMKDIKYILSTAIFTFPFISIIPIVLAYAYFGFFSFNAFAFLVFFVSFIVVVFLILLLSFCIAVLLHKVKIDPDNGGIPLATTIGDVFGTIYAVAVAWLFITF